MSGWSRTSVAYLCIIVIALAAFLPGVAAFDYVVPDLPWILLPDLAVTAECKRLKVLARRNGTDHENRIEALGRGVAQVNALSNLGIHRTFLVVILLVDGRNRTENNVLFRRALVA